MFFFLMLFQSCEIMTATITGPCDSLSRCLLLDLGAHALTAATVVSVIVVLIFAGTAE